MNAERIRELEAELLAVFNEQQEIEGFTVDDESEEIYRAKDANDGLFVYWLEDCRLDEAHELRELRCSMEGAMK